MFEHFGRDSNSARRGRSALAWLFPGLRPMPAKPFGESQRDNERTPLLLFSTISSGFDCASMKSTPDCRFYVYKRDGERASQPIYIIYRRVAGGDSGFVISAFSSFLKYKKDAFIEQVAESECPRLAALRAHASMAGGSQAPMHCTMRTTPRRARAASRQTPRVVPSRPPPRTHRQRIPRSRRREVLHIATQDRAGADDAQRHCVGCSR